MMTSSPGPICKALSASSIAKVPLQQSSTNSTSWYEESRSASRRVLAPWYWPQPPSSKLFLIASETSSHAGGHAGGPSGRIGFPPRIAGSVESFEVDMRFLDPRDRNLVNRLRVQHHNKNIHNIIFNRFTNIKGAIQ